MLISKAEVSWHNVPALLLETNALQVIVVPEMGAKIVSIYDKPNDVEWLVPVRDRPFQPVKYGAIFTDQDMSGWDEMFPTIVECAYPVAGSHYGVTLPDHGEVWAMPWTVNNTAKDTISTTVQGQALPYSLTREISFVNEMSLRFTYTLESHSNEAMPYLWAAHPQFWMKDAGEVILPSEVSEVINVLPTDWGWGDIERSYRWPSDQLPNGEQAQINEIGAHTRKRARKFFTKADAMIESAAVVRKPKDTWIHMSWNAGDVPYFGVWVDEGAVSYTSAAAPEPMTGYYDSLETAWKNKRVKTIQPGGRTSWKLRVSVGKGLNTLP